MKRPVRDPVTGTYTIKGKHLKSYLAHVNKCGMVLHIKLNMV